MRTLKRIIPSTREDIGDLRTQRAMPTELLSMIDPFLFLNHHGPQIYPKNNRGLPFAPHPHRGFETVTFILDGDIAHKDSKGHESVIDAGGVQWMTAGSGLVHEEISSDQFKKNGGPLEILQLWVNLPSKLKMTAPSYKGHSKEEIPVTEGDGYKVEIVSGEINGIKGPFKSITGITSMLVTVDQGKTFELPVSQNQNIFFYVIRGQVEISGKFVQKFQTVEFLNDDSNIIFNAVENSKVLICHGEPLNEPVVSYGPFVMNTKEEIMKAVQDFQAGKFD